ncbi:MAG: hypothetical protein ABFR97_05355 [Thermodesulfobacteriota bacterium]
MKNNKRRNIFVNKRYQGRLMLQFYLLLTVSSLIFSLLLAYFTSDSLTIVYQGNDLQVGRTPLLFVQQMLKAGWVLLIPFGFIVLLVVFWQTQRMAGPLYRFEKILQEMNGGHIGQTVHLRPKDDGKAVARNLTDLNAKLAITMQKLGELSFELEGIVAGPSISSKWRQVRIRELSEEISQAVRAYKIAGNDWPMESGRQQLAAAEQTLTMEEYLRGQRAGLKALFTPRANSGQQISDPGRHADPAPDLTSDKSNQTVADLPGTISGNGDRPRAEGDAPKRGSSA